TEDMIGVINGVTGRDYHDFFRRYVLGVEVPSYDTIFGYAGYRIEKTARQAAFLGFDAGNRRGVLYVRQLTPNSPAAKAGLEIGDSILRINGLEPFSVNINELAGKAAKFIVRREGEEKELAVNVATRTETSYRLIEITQPTPEQSRIREAWLKVVR